MNFFQAWALTVGIETIILYFLFRKRYCTDIIARNSVLASTITLPLVWFVFTQFGLNQVVRIVISELFAIGVETYIYARLFQGLKARDAFIASLICNVSSFLVGLIFPFVYGQL